MNTKNNKRRRESQEKIEKAFMQLLQDRELKDVTVSDLCKMTELNRSTFYANYLDVYDLADKLRLKLEAEFGELFRHDPSGQVTGGALKMFTHIRDNQIFYKTYFKLGYDEKLQVFVYDRERAKEDFGNEHIRYHIEFFRHGINAMIKMWLADGCKETPEEMAEIIRREYGGRRGAEKEIS